MNNFKNRTIKYIPMMIILLSVNSCVNPTTKEAYLSQFEKFVDNVKEDHGNYTKSDWKYADERFRKFSQEWFDQFKDELTVKEELKVAGLIVKYQAYKGADKLEEIYNKNMKDDVDKMKEKIEYYIDNDMDEDLEKLKKGAKEISDSTLKVVEDIIDSFRK